MGRITATDWRAHHSREHGDRADRAPLTIFAIVMSDRIASAARRGVLIDNIGSVLGAPGIQRSNRLTCAFYSPSGPCGPRQVTGCGSGV